MKGITIITLTMAAMVVISCETDFSNVDVTYTRATGQYENLSVLRNTALKDPSRQIIDPGKIFVATNTLLVGEVNEGIHVIDNKDPESPVQKLFINIPGNKEFYVEEGILYAESYYDMLKIDVTDLDQPMMITRVENAFGEALTNDTGEALIGFDFEIVTEQYNEKDGFFQYITANETVYYDYQNRVIPESTVPSSFAGNDNQVFGSVNRIARYNNHVYVLSSSRVTVFRDMDMFEWASTNDLGWQMETIFPYDDKLFIGTQTSMEVFSLNFPEEPSHLTSFWHATSCDPVYPLDDVAYVTLRTGDIATCPGDTNALVVLDIRTITNPIPVQEIAMQSPFGMTMANNRLYVGEGENGLKIFDAVNRTNLVLEVWDKSITAYDIIPHPNRSDIMLIAGPEGLGQYRINGVGDIDQLSLVAF